MYKHTLAIKIENPKSKSQAQVQVRADDWVCIKSDFPTIRPAGKVSKKQDKVIYPNQKLLVAIKWLYNMFWNKPRPKINPLGVKTGRKPFNPRIF